VIAGDRTTGRLEIPRRFNGPPATANGGYACGAIAAFADGPVEVSLRAPPPLETPLDVRRGADGRIAVTQGDVLVADAGPADLSDVVPPVRPTVAEAREAMRGHPFHGADTFAARCFVCSPQRHDGLGVHFGPLPGWPKLNAALLIGDATLPHHDGVLADRIAWAALDCVSYTPELWRSDGMSLLGAMAAEVLEPVPTGEPVVAVAWPLETSGRRHRSASTLLRADGRMLARARALWIRLRGPGEGVSAGGS
jgi:hypothetical protein